MRRVVTTTATTAATTAALAAASVLTAVPAGAAATAPPVTVTVQSCRLVELRIAVPAGKKYIFDSNRLLGVSGVQGRSTERLTLAPGRYTWRMTDQATRRPVTHGDFTVPSCPGVRPGPGVFRGDEDGDRRADLLAVHQDGRLLYYRWTGSVLSPGQQVGTGWAGVQWAARPGAWNTYGLTAVAKDGTLTGYRYQLGHGRYTEPYPLARNAGGLTQTYLTAGSDAAETLWPVLHGVRAGKGVAFPIDDARRQMDGGYPAALPKAPRVVPLWDLDGDAWGDEARIAKDGTMNVVLRRWDRSERVVGLGGGWGRMTSVTSPGDMTGDGLSDLVARRGDGTLWLYAGRKTVNGAGFAAARRIGTGWNGIRIIL